MEYDLVNLAYLQELLEVTKDQQEFDLLSQLFRRLIASRDEFISSFQSFLIEDPNQISFQLHKLKNQFANLGCVAVSHYLEEMYQMARQQKLNEVEEMLAELKFLSERTFQTLSSELSH
jgi:hypothetical protein